MQDTVQQKTAPLRGELEHLEEARPLRKANELVVMMPKEGRITPQMRKLYISMLRDAQQQLMEMGGESDNFKATDFFRAPLSRIIRPISSKNYNLVTAAKNYIKEMQSVQVEWSAPDANSGVVWDNMVLISQAKLQIEHGRLHLLWAFPPDIVRALNPKRNFTIVAPEELTQLTTNASIALYLIATRYRNNWTQVTSKKNKDWWIRALGGGKNINREWRKFKYEAILPAIKQINAVTDLDVQIIEKKGDSEDVQFKIIQKAYNNKTGVVTQAHIEAKELGVPSKDITNFIASGRDINQARLVLSGMKEMASRPNAEPIENPAAYFQGALNPKRSFSTSNQVQPELPFDEVVEPLTITQRFTEIVQQLDDSSTDLLLAKVKDKMAAKGLLSPATIKRINEKNWRGGLLLYQMVETYAIENFGPNWQTISPDEV